MNGRLGRQLIILLVGGGLIWGVQQSVLIRVNREEKRLDRKYAVLTAVSSIPARYYHEVWNLWHGVKNQELQENRIRYRERMQEVVVEADSINAELPVLFRNQNIANAWSEFLTIYQNAVYPITRTGISEEDLNKKLAEASPFIARVIQNIYKEIEYNKQLPPLSSTKVFGLIALFCSFGVAWTAFINNFKNDLHSQLMELIRKGSNGDYDRDIRKIERFFAKKRYSMNKNNWMEAFDDTNQMARSMESDKSSSIRSIFWFLLYTAFIIIALILS